MTIKKIVLLCNSFLIISFSISHGQNQVTVAPVIGVYLYNSENSLPVMGNKNYLLNYGLELNYENKNLFGYDIQISYSYLYTSVDSVIEFDFYSPAPFPQPDRYFYTDVALSLNTLDIDIKDHLGGFFSYGLGPSFSIVNRSVFFDHADFVDRLASFNVGLNGLLEMRIPFSNKTNFWYFYSGLKFRYLHGLLYDEGLRDLSDYNQNFVTANFVIGIGYNF